MNRGLILIGLVFIVVGLVWPWLVKLPFGRLPGDIRIEGDGYAFYFPLTTGLLLSAMVSLLWWLFHR